MADDGDADGGTPGRTPGIAPVAGLGLRALVRHGGQIFLTSQISRPFDGRLKAGVGAAFMLRAWPTPAQDAQGHPPDRLPSGFPLRSPLQGWMGRRRSGASLLSSGSPITTSSSVQAPRGVGRPRETTSGLAELSTSCITARPGEIHHNPGTILSPQNLPKANRPG